MRLVLLFAAKFGGFQNVLRDAGVRAISSTDIMIMMLHYYIMYI